MFTKLDMSQAYLQVLVDIQSKELLMINMHKDLFAYNRLPFGVSSAPGIFQRTIDQYGIYPSGTKVQAIKAALKPRNVSELISYLDLLTYCGKFLPIVSTLLAPLYHLLRKDVKWCWDETQQQSLIK